MPKGGGKSIPYPGYTKLKREITIKTRKFMVNKLLKRKQMVVDIHHQHMATPRKKLIRSKIAKLYKVRDPKTIVLFGTKSKYGGGTSKCFCLIYDDFKSRKRYDYKYRLVRVELLIYHICLSVHLFVLFFQIKLT